MSDPTLQGNTIGRLARLDQLDDDKVADGDPDVRGWDVQAADGREVGKVDSLFVDTAAMERWRGTRAAFGKPSSRR